MNCSLADVNAGFTWLAKQKGFTDWRITPVLDSENSMPIGYALKFTDRAIGVAGYAYDGGRYLDGDRRLRPTAPTGPALWECSANIDKSVPQLSKILQDVLNGDYLIFGRRADGSRFVQRLNPKNRLSLEELIIRAKLEA